MLRTMILAALLGSAACVATGTVRGGGGYYAEPELVEIQPGVQVIVDYDEPVFYSDNYYWRNDGGVWYRSSYHNRGWITAQPPAYVARIDSPGRYRHYRPANYQPGVRDHRGNRGYDENRGGYNDPPPQGPVVRDHRGDGYNPPPPPPPQGPVVRDHGGGGGYNPPPPPTEPTQGPVVREHGGGSAPPPPAPPPPPPRREEPKGPVVREHR